MSEAELLKITLERMNMSYSEAANILGMTKGTFSNYTAGKCSVPPKIWMALLELEAKAYQRHKDIQERVKGL